MKDNCRECEKEFDTHIITQRFCSSTCQKKYTQRKTKERTKRILDGKEDPW